MFIDSDGNAGLCSIYRKPGISLIKNTAEMVWRSLEIENSKIVDFYNSSICCSCKYKPFCRWCPGYSLLETGLETSTEK
jgi:radical SAM protein with 4Fe4S-binding SPASM domain